VKVQAFRRSEGFRVFEQGAPMDFPWILNNVGSVITLGLGALGLTRPQAVASFTSIQALGLTGVSEIRATYGGFFLALGAYALYAQAAEVFLVVGLAWLGAALGRLASVVIDRSRAPKNLAGIVFESAVGALLLIR
jgi:hypothetical protein